LRFCAIRKPARRSCTTPRTTIPHRAFFFIIVSSKRTKVKNIVNKSLKPRRNRYSMDETKDSSTEDELFTEPVANVARKRRNGPRPIARKRKAACHPHGLRPVRTATFVSPPGPAPRTLDLSSDVEDDDNIDHNSDADHEMDDGQTTANLDPNSILDLHEMDIHWSNDVLPPNSRNIAIAYLFIHVHNAPEPKEWIKSGGVMLQIKNALKINKNTSILSVLRHVWACHTTNVVYNGKTSFEINKRGPKYLIDVKSPTAKMITDALEKGYSRAQTQQFVNRWLQKEKKGLITMHQIYSLVERLKPAVTPIQQRSQGSADPNSKWARARYNIVRQLLFRLGNNANDLDVKLPNGDVPPYFDKSKLEPLDIYRIAFWDETHKKCRIGGQAGSAKKRKLPSPETKKANSMSTEQLSPTLPAA
jgi:hypothetical protein